MSKLFVVSAPSGTGKTTLNNRLMNEYPFIEISISHTTRMRRDGEVEGSSYHFVSVPDFQRLIAKGHMLEWAEVFGNFYGTSRDELDRIFAKGHHVLLEIDVQGCRSVLSKKSDAVTVFILPPSIEDLWRRLERRNTDKLEDRWRRLLTAKHEIEAGNIYEHFIINDDMERAYKELKGIIVDSRHSNISHDDGVDFCQKLIREFDSSPLLRELKKQFGNN